MICHKELSSNFDSPKRSNAPGGGLRVRGAHRAWPSAPWAVPQQLRLRGHAGHRHHVSPAVSDGRWGNFKQRAQDRGPRASGTPPALDVPGRGFRTGTCPWAALQTEREAGSKERLPSAGRKRGGGSCTQCPPPAPPSPGTSADLPTGLRDEPARSLLSCLASARRLATGCLFCDLARQGAVLPI